MVLLKDLVHLHHRGQHLLPLRRTEIDALVLGLLELLAIDQPPDLEVAQGY